MTEDAMEHASYHAKRVAEKMEMPEYRKAFEEAVEEIKGATYLDCGCMVKTNGERIFGPVGCPEHPDEDLR